MIVVGKDLKLYLSSSLSTRMSVDGCIMEPSNSCVEFNLNISGNNTCVIGLKRISGNGRIIINNKVKNIISKTGQKIEIELKDDILKFKRDTHATGKILIYSIEIKEAVENMPANWKTILSQCGDIKHIKLSKNRLFASESGFIEKANLIQSITTNPPNAAIIGDNIKFAISCEIIDITLKENNPANLSKPIFQHMSAPAKIVAEAQPIINKYQDQQYVQSQVPGIQCATGSQVNNILYDSYMFGLNPSALIQSKEITGGYGSNSKGLKLGRFAKFNIPLTTINPYTEYVVVITGKKINGNGKVGLCFSSPDGIKRNEVVVLLHERPTKHYIKLNSYDAPPLGTSYMLQIFRPEHSTIGEIIIERLMVIQGISTVPTQTLTVHNNSHATINPQYPIVSSLNVSKHTITEISKKYAVYPTYNVSEPQFNIKGLLAATNYSALSWYSKLKPLCPKLQLNNKIDESTVVIGDLNSIVKGNKYWIDYFDTDVISDKTDSYLKDAKLITSPSLQNVNFLKQKYPDKNIIHLERPWPIINSTKIKLPSDDYFIYFHRDNDISRHIINIFNDENFPIPIIIGYRGDINSRALLLNEYISYDKILHLILNSKFILDINNNYSSALLSLANSIGLPIITSNTYGENKSNVKLIKTENKLPDCNEILKSINEILQTSISIEAKDHNAKLENFFHTLFNYSS